MELLNDIAQEDKTYSVSELNRATKNLLSRHFSGIKVEGEISNLSTPSSGHIYFSLKDRKAQIRCAMFKSQQRRLKFKPQNGNQVILSAQVSLYEARGDYQLIVDNMQEAGAGNLQLAFEKLKTRLLEEGLFDQNLKQPLPEIPQQIGVISSATGAAVHDILSVLKRRFPAIPVIIYPTVVQGELAKFEIVKAIETANQQKQVDIILLARGGGSLEDLWTFNEELVAKAIYNSKIPIMTGIGHEVDFTIADFVADLRAPTPSAAAEKSVPSQQAWLNRFQILEHQLHQITHRHIKGHQQSINWINKRLQQQHPGQQLQNHAQTLDNLETRLNRAIDSKFRQAEIQLQKQQHLLHKQSPVHNINSYQSQQKYLQNRLKLAIQHKLENSKNKFHALTQTLNAVSPLATLERGYAITSKANTDSVITSSQQLSINEQIKTRLAQGNVISEIKQINHE